MSADRPEITKAERADLAKLARLRERVAKEDAAVRASELRTDLELQLSAIYSFDQEEVWQAAREAVTDAATTANAAVSARCAEMGIPAEFRPSVSVGWSSRGQSQSASRRAELRRLGHVQIDELLKGAKHEISRASLSVQTEILAGGLDTPAARAFLETMPTAEQLMPTLDAKALSHGKDGRSTNEIGPA